MKEGELHDIRELISKDFVRIKEELANKKKEKEHEKKNIDEEDQMWDMLPEEVWYHIASHLSPLDLVRLSSTNLYFNSLCNDSQLWQVK